MLSKKGMVSRQIDEGGHPWAFPSNLEKIHGATLRHQRPEQLCSYIVISDNPRLQYR